MNAKSNQLEIELNQTTKRLDELTEMRDRLNNNLQILQQDFIDGKTSLDAVQTEQGQADNLRQFDKGVRSQTKRTTRCFPKGEFVRITANLTRKGKSNRYRSRIIS
jgi:septal ring factor EnvC (AmiA/AmiB activator)